MTDPMELVGRLEKRGRTHRARASGLQKRIDAGDRSVSIQDPQNAIREAETDEKAAACIREMVEWQPIETAPHETLVVLGWFEDGVWKQDLGLASAGQRWPTGFSNMWCHGSATHWLPLHPAPGAEA